MSPLDQVIAELEAEKQHLELTLAFLRGRRSLAAVTAPPPPRLVPPAVPASADAAVGEAFTAAQKALAPVGEPATVVRPKPAPAASTRLPVASKKAPARPATAATAKPIAPPRVTATSTLSPLAERVLARLNSSGDKAVDIARALKLPTPRVKWALVTLKQRGLAKTVGKTAAAVWVSTKAVAPTKATSPQPQAARPPLKTLPAAAPVMAAPAQPARPAIVSEGVELVPVYSAAMERAGERKLSEVRA